MTTDDVSAPTTNTLTPPIRWWPVPVSLVVGVTLQTVATIYFGENKPYLNWACVFIIWPLTVFLLLLWWLFWSRLPWRVRGVGLLGVLTVAASGLAAARFEEFDGAMLPRFSPRWKPSRKEQAAEFFKNVATKTEVAASDDLSNESLVPTDSDWPAFRGPNRDDVVVGDSLRTDWDARPPKLLWKHPIGPGWGTFAVIGRRAWTLEQRGDNELCVCYDVETGRELWTHADAVRFSSPQGGVGPCSTPTLHDGKVFAQGATGILNCLDAATGQRVWTRNTLEDSGSPNLPWGQCGSPLIVDDLVVVAPGANNEAAQAKQSAVIAYRRDSGEKVWSVGKHIGSYASPHLVTLNGERQVLIYHGLGVTAYSPETGQSRWSFAWENTPQINAAQPIVLDDQRVLIGSGYGQGSVLIEVASTNTVESKWLGNERWQSRDFKLKFNGAVRRGDFVYGLDEGLLTCLSLSDGKRRWKKGRYGHGQMMLVGDTLLILSEAGEVVLVSATPDAPKELARLQAIEGKTWNHPVVSRGRMLVRNSDEAACFDLR